MRRNQPDAERAHGLGVAAQRHRDIGQAGALRGARELAALVRARVGLSSSFLCRETSRSGGAPRLHERERKICAV